jgi:hypothetical protein
MYHNSGDGMQINAGSYSAQASTHHIFVGGNETWENKQTGLWCKQAVDVIFSQNISHHHRPSDSSDGAGMGCQYDPERLWFICNYIYDCEYGIVMKSGSGMGFGTQTYLLGNVIHDIHHTTSYNPDTSWSQAAIMLAGGTTCHIIGNTLYDVDAGINIPSGAPRNIVNTIISKITEPQGRHLFFEFQDSADRSDLRYSLLYQDDSPLRIKWGVDTCSSIAAFQAATGKGQGCLSADPMFVDAEGGDLHLQSSSPAKDAGVVHEIYTEFFNRYGVDISVDFDGTPRAQGDGPDIGACEAPE